MMCINKDMIFKLFAVLVWTGIFSVIQAQETPREVTDSMQKLSFLIGEWEGTGWQMDRNGQKQTFNQTEKINWKLGTTLIVVEGLGKLDNGSDKGNTVHKAFGVISYRMDEGKYNFDAFLSDGKSNHSEALLTADNQFIWKIEMPHGGTVRYTLQVIDGKKWNEIGEYSRDGENWSQFMEMNLQKK